jgi:Ca2+-transporting ATPase
MPSRRATATAAPAIAPDVPWHTLGPDEVARHLAVDPLRGLPAPEAGKRLALHGPNHIPERPARSPLAMFLGQFADFMIGVLLGAAAVSAVLGEVVDAVVILVIVLLNAVLGFAQEYRAERALEALRALAAPSARVRRDGSVGTVPTTELVPGDVVLVDAGSIVPADLRLVEAARLHTAEAALTGESEPVEKRVDPHPDPALPVADRRGMAWKGTVCAAGRGVGIVVATGASTELGRIAGLLDPDGRLATPLQARLARFGRRLAFAVLAICGVIFVAGLLRGEPPLLMFMTAISLAVAAIPEALPAVVAISLALGARRMVRQHALVRRLPAVETLGSVTVICSDKTGTLTLNRMTVERLWSAGILRMPGPDWADDARWGALANAMVLVNDATGSRAGSVEGEPTETALLDAALASGIDVDALRRHHPRVAEIPFDSDRKRMTTIHSMPDGTAVAWVKGAPETVLPLCGHRFSAGAPEPVDTAAATIAAEAMAAEGLRVMAFALRRFDAVPPDLAEADRELVLVGLAGMTDPPRPEAAGAVAQCIAAGIVPVMITGDHPATARAIARRLGILGEDDAVVTGAALAAVDDATLAERAGRIRVYARVDPAQKIRIVAALQARGECVAMTGDGVNDAPALQRADIGIAMGRGGTDVAREASALVLLDDHFATIVNAVREGRRIYDNIRKFVRYAMTGNAGEIWTIFLAPFLGMPVPLLPIHILWVNLVTDGLPGLALAREQGERRIMTRPPRRPRESLFAGGLWQHIVWVGLLIGGVSLLAQAWAIREGAPAQSMVFTVLTLSQLAHVLAIRSERESFLATGPLSNPWLVGSVAGTFALQLAILYVPWCNAVFRTEPLALREVALAIALALVVFAGVELEKWAMRRGWLYRGSA